MNQDSKPHNPFSLIADFDGDIRDLFAHRHDGEIPILPLRNLVLFPGVVTTVTIGRESSMALIRHITNQTDDEGYFAVATQVDAEVESPQFDDLYPVGTLAKLLRVIELPDQKTTAIIQAYGRVALHEGFTQEAPFIVAPVTSLPEELPADDDKEFVTLCEQFRSAALDYVKMSDALGMEAQMAVQNISNPVFFINFMATNLSITTEEKALLLLEDSFMERTYALLRLLNREIQLLDLSKQIQERTHREIDRQQKEYFLQQQLKYIHNELGDGEDSESAQLRAKIEGLPLPDNIRTLFEKEVKKLDRLNPGSPDYGVTLTYLDTIASLPWGKATTDNCDLRHARRILDRDHYGMEKVKERIIEQLALLSVSTTHRPAILCLVGPPGVGKTSLCRSIAESLGRKYVRVSLGGLHDESEIRGHRRTYVAAMCGRIMKGIIKSESNNPLFVLDEIDKVSGNNHNGDPQSALLELLDPEQNNTFHDNYLDFDYDLSQVFFIATANSLSGVPRPLLDRMELIEVEGYLTEEKKEIMRRHLVPKAMKDLSVDFTLKFTPAGSEYLIEHYTRESGVRQLTKCIDKIVRKEVVRHLESPAADATQGTSPSLRPADIEDIMGKPIYTRDIYENNNTAGVVTGLAWTPVGGEILFIESSLNASSGNNFTLTGNIGNVMRESATIAFQYVKAHADELGIPTAVFDHWKLHVHVPEGSTPKDGPSAGITLATSIASVFTQRKVRKRLAMSGEITLRGKVLPVGGLKEKILAAKRAGIKEIILSKTNVPNIEEIPERYIKDLTFHYVDTVEEVWAIALLDEKVSHPLDLTPPQKTTTPDHEPK